MDCDEHWEAIFAVVFPTDTTILSTEIKLCNHIKYTRLYVDNISSLINFASN